MPTRPLYKELAAKVDAWKRSKQRGNSQWVTQHEKDIENLVKKYMPRGSGFDAGTTLDLEMTEAQKKDCLYFRSSYHVMHENGMYMGWIDFDVEVTPSLQFDFDIDIIGIPEKLGNEDDDADVDNDFFKNYFAEEFGYALQKEITI